MCVYVNMWLCVHTWRPEALDSLELELQGTELRSSEEQKVYLTLYPPPKKKKPHNFSVWCLVSNLMSAS